MADTQSAPQCAFHHREHERPWARKRVYEVIWCPAFLSKVHANFKDDIETQEK